MKSKKSSKKGEKVISYLEIAPDDNQINPIPTFGFGSMFHCRIDVMEFSVSLDFKWSVQAPVSPEHCKTKISALTQPSRATRRPAP